MLLWVQASLLKLCQTRDPCGIFSNAVFADERHLISTKTDFFDGLFKEPNCFHDFITQKEYPGLLSLLHTV